MQRKQFKIDNIPEINNMLNKTEIDIAIIDIYNNYILLLKDSIRIVDLSLKNDITKPLLMYNLFFIIELFLKFYLMRTSKHTIELIEGRGHNIYELIKLIENEKEKKRFDELLSLISELRTKNNTKLDIIKYAHYKYNHEKSNTTLIFDFETSEKEKDKIKEIVIWIKSYIQNL